MKTKKILLARTDRIGDVLLSTPIIENLRKAYPRAHLAILVRPYTKDIVFGNPYLDEVIVYGKYGRHKNLLATIIFALNLRKKNFDLALILHPTNRMHLVCFLAGIKRRIGYDRKLSFLLTDKIRHKKQSGQRHESDYTLDFLRYLNIPASRKSPFMPIRKDSEEYIIQFLKRSGINLADRLLALGVGASCPSKIWLPERFAWVGDRMVEEFGFKVILIGDQRDANLAEQVEEFMKNKPLNLCGRVSLSQLASLLRRCRLFISNDSGAMHIAAALSTPCVVIFGRNQAGLSPRRWGPLGANNIILHRDVGCQECLAHNCKKNFACLTALKKEEVFQVTRRFIRSWSKKK